LKALLPTEVCCTYSNLSSL